MAGAGGLVRDSTGKWLVGFMVHRGVCSNMVAEMEAVRFGLNLAWEEGYRNIVCEVDALVALELFATADVSVHPLGSLIADVRQLRSRGWSCTFSHTLREGNFCADHLAKEACSLDEDFEVLREPPLPLVPLFVADSHPFSFIKFHLPQHSQSGD